jgi:acyl-CoA thioester hydrolase
VKPIVYSNTISVRFSDLDPYGHVSSALYLDYVISSRVSYAKHQLHIDERTLVKRGIGFFLAQADTRFVLPVVGVQELLVSSCVERIDGAQLHVPYEIRLADERLANQGQLRFAVIDLTTNRPTVAPDWVLALFQTSAP